MPRYYRRRFHHRALAALRSQQGWRTHPLWRWLAVAVPLGAGVLTVRMVLRFAR